MKAEKIMQKTKNLSFENVTNCIEKIGLELELVQDLPFTKMWKVKNNKEFYMISNTWNCYTNYGDVAIFYNE
jgi:hypothetical protein